MAMNKKQIALFAILIWIFLIDFFMILSPSPIIDFELFFCLSFLGILIMFEVLTPLFVKPRYILYLRYIVAVGVMIFGVIIAQKILDVFGFEFTFSAPFPYMSLPIFAGFLRLFHLGSMIYF